MIKKSELIKQIEYYKNSIKDLKLHYTDCCCMCSSSNVNCDECIINDIIEQLNEIATRYNEG